MRKWLKIQTRRKNNKIKCEFEDVFFVSFFLSSLSLSSFEEILSFLDITPDDHRFVKYKIALVLICNVLRLRNGQWYIRLKIFCLWYNKW